MPEFNDTPPIMAGDFQQVPEPTTDTSADSFLKEVAQPTIAAVDNGGFAPPPPGNAPVKEEPAPNTYVPPADAQPIFEKPQTDATAPGKDAPKEKPLSADYKDMLLRQLVKIENNVSATLCAIASGNMDDAGMFKSGDEDINDLIEALEPYKDSISNVVPTWLPALMIYGAIKTKQIGKAVTAHKTNKANKQAAGDTETVQKVARAYSAQSNSPRSNFRLYADGFYATDRTGAYLKRTDEDHVKMREKPNIADLDKILLVKSNRNREILKAAFGWTNSDFDKQNIALNDE